MKKYLCKDGIEKIITDASKPVVKNAALIIHSRSSERPKARNYQKLDDNLIKFRKGKIYLLTSKILLKYIWMNVY